MLQLGHVGGNQYQSCLQRAAFHIDKMLYSAQAAGIATETVYSLGGIGDNTTPVYYPGCFAKFD